MPLNPYTFLRKALEERDKAKQYRQLVVSTNDGIFVEREGKRLINFSSNDYLGLSSNDDVALTSKKFIDQYGNGSSASRLITGTGTYHMELEHSLAAAMSTEAALIFNSGYQANTTIIPAISGREALILSDKLNHNSLVQGASLSHGKHVRYRHNDIDHLKTLLDRNAGNYEQILIVTESVFSMDGDIADLNAITRLAQSFEALLMVDEAHAIGVWGNKGMGLCANKIRPDLIIGTFGKAFGSFGAFVGCSQDMRDYLINYCGGFIYTTALPSAVIGACSKSLELLLNMDKERNELQENIKYLRTGLQEAGYDTLQSNSQIIPIVIGDEEETIALSDYLIERGLFAIAIRPPTVNKNSSRIRITLTARHELSHIDQLLNALVSWNG